MIMIYNLQIKFYYVFSFSDMGLCRIYFSNTKALSLNSLDHSQQDTQDKLSCYGNKSIGFCFYLFFALFYKVTFNSLTTFVFYSIFFSCEENIFKEGDELKLFDFLTNKSRYDVRDRPRLENHSLPLEIHTSIFVYFIGNIQAQSLEFETHLLFRHRWKVCSCLLSRVRILCFILGWAPEVYKLVKRY